MFDQQFHSVETKFFHQRMWQNLPVCCRLCMAWSQNRISRRHFEHKRWNRELTVKCKLKCYVTPMKDPLGVGPSKGNQETTRGKEKILLTSVGIEPTTSGLVLPLLCRLSYEVGQRKSGIILGGESRQRESKGTYECSAA